MKIHTSGYSTNGILDIDSTTSLLYTVRSTAPLQALHPTERTDFRMNTSQSAIRDPHYGIYRHFFELIIKIACIFATSTLMVQAFATYFAHLNTEWQFHVSYSALIFLEAVLMVSWFGVETQHEVPKALKFIAAMILLGTLATIFTISMLYTGDDHFVFKGLLLSLIFLRCTLSGISIQAVETRKLSRAEALVELRVRSKRKQQLLAAKDKIRRKQMNKTHQNALKEVELLKQHLITKARAKHLLAMAQINSRVSDTNRTHEQVIVDEELAVS